MLKSLVDNVNEKIALAATATSATAATADVDTILRILTFILVTIPTSVYYVRRAWLIGKHPKNKDNEN